MSNDEGGGQVPGLEPYILVGADNLLVLQARVNLYVNEGYEPIGAPFNGFKGGNQYFQAMYRAPDQKIDTRLSSPSVQIEPYLKDRVASLTKRCSAYAQALVEARFERDVALRRAEAAERRTTEPEVNDIEPEDQLTNDERRRLFRYCREEAAAMERQEPSGGTRIWMPFQVSDEQLDEVIEIGTMTHTPKQIRLCRDYLAKRDAGEEWPAQAEAPNFDGSDDQISNTEAGGWPEAACVAQPEYRAEQELENLRARHRLVSQQLSEYIQRHDAYQERVAELEKANEQLHQNKDESAKGYRTRIDQLEAEIKRLKGGRPLTDEEIRSWNEEVALRRQRLTDEEIAKMPDRPPYETNKITPSVTEHLKRAVMYAVKLPDDSVRRVVADRHVVSGGETKEVTLYRADRVVSHIPGYKEFWCYDVPPGVGDRLSRHFRLVVAKDAKKLEENLADWLDQGWSAVGDEFPFSRSKYVPLIGVEKESYVARIVTSLSKTLWSRDVHCDDNPLSQAGVSASDQNDPGRKEP